MKNILTFDIEDWYHPNLADKELLNDLPLEDRVEAPTLRILNMLDETNNKATFFVVGDVVEKFPNLVAEMVRRGHEVGSHGHRHNLVYQVTKAQFETDLTQALKTLEKITNRRVLGYRAPSWSLGQRTPWAWHVLNELGFAYDSSLYPFETFLYGDNGSPRFEFQVELPDGGTFREIPPSVAEVLGKRLPFSGGFFFRVVPYALIKWGIRQHHAVGKPAVMYLHPWELDVDQPRLKVDARKRFILYANLDKTERKLQRLLREFRFVSIRDYLGLDDTLRGSREDIVTTREVA
ncbi:MAG: polysaccharide deacetylase family protein [bacterium]